MAIRTTHVGSLPRPSEMITRLQRKEQLGPADIGRYVAEVVERQLALGLTYVNDGELPRADYVSATLERLAGFDGTCTAPVPADLEAVPEYARRFSGRNGLITLNPKAAVSVPACTAELGYRGDASLRAQLDDVSRALRGRRAGGGPAPELFFTAPSPGTLALFLENRYYPSYERYVNEIGRLMSREYEAIQASGAMLQVDCPDLAMGRHTVHKKLTDAGFLAVAEINVAALNAALRGVDPARCRAHVCWGNYPGTHHCDVELAVILATIAKLAPRFISLEASNHRHAHEWEVLRERRLPEDKVLMPGVVDTRSNTVEHPDLVARRLRDFVSVLGEERVVASTDCGFASTASSAAVSGEVAWLKLEAMVEGARRASR